VKLGIFTALLGKRPLDEALDFVCELGIEAVEIGVGGYASSRHLDVKKLLSSVNARSDFLANIRGRGLEISALSAHGNPLHPKVDVAKAHHQALRNAVRLAKMLGVPVVNCFSGCPGGSDRDSTPNWVTCPWPEDFSKILKWQWERKVLPCWKQEAKYADSNGVKLAIEMHPGFVVYNAETLLRLREAAGSAIGANFDPSHLFWQGMDPLASVRALKGCIYHVHAKDCRIYPTNCDVNGVLDTKPYSDEINRSWIFRTVGYGHGHDFWNDLVSTLRMVGYDGALSIEHEDSLMSTNEGFQKAVTFLKDVLLHEKPGAMWWA
jgi:sugar phosphate isomerase/epimerase